MGLASGVPGPEGLTEDHEPPQELEAEAQPAVGAHVAEREAHVPVHGAGVGLDHALLGAVRPNSRQAIQGLGKLHRVQCGVEYSPVQYSTVQFTCR